MSRSFLFLLPLILLGLSACENEQFTQNIENAKAATQNAFQNIKGSVRQMNDRAYYALKAKPVKLSPFIELNGNLRQINSGVFHYTWLTTNPTQLSRLAAAREINITTVNVNYLRPVRIFDFKPKYAAPERAAAADLGRTMRDKFAQAFIDSSGARFHWVRSPTRGGVTLELSVVELNPTSIPANIGKTVGNALTMGTYGTATTAAFIALDPALEIALPASGGFRGNMAIEGKLRLNDTGEVVYEFADNEQDKVTVVSVRDFRPYSHCLVSIQEWAEQFETAMRNPLVPQERTSVFRFNPL